MAKCQIRAWIGLCFVFIYFSFIYICAIPAWVYICSFFFSLSLEFSFVMGTDKSSGDFRMSDFGRRVVKGPKSTNSHSLKMKDLIGTCSVSTSLKSPVQCLLLCTGVKKIRFECAFYSQLTFYRFKLTLLQAFIASWSLILCLSV